MKRFKFFALLFSLLRMLHAFFAWIASLFLRAVSKSKEFSSIVQMIAGAAVMLLPAAYSAFTILLPKHPAIFITFAGAAIGAWIFAEGLRQYKNKFPAEPDSTSEKKANEAKVRELQKEVNRLQNMTLDVNSIERVLSVSLLEMETHLRDFKKGEIANTLNESIFGNKRTISEYLGYIDEKIRVRYGIDLNKIRIREEGSTIVVSGVKSEYQGVLKRDTVDKHYEVREKKISVDGKDTIHSYTIPQGDKDGLLIEAYEEHRATLNEKLNSGIDLTGLGGANTFVEKIGQEFVKNFLLPIGKQVEFVDESEDRGYSLEEFVQSHNFMVESERMKLLETE